jgi:hypothetical protein
MSQVFDHYAIAALKQPLTITLDPRVHVSQDDLEQQLDAAKKITAGLQQSNDAYNAAAALQTALAEREKSLDKVAASAGGATSSGTAAGHVAPKSGAN